MLNKISFSPMLITNLKKTAIAGLLGTNVYTTSATIPKNERDTVVFETIDTKLANENENNKNKTYKHNQWTKDSINMANQIKQNQTQINNLTQELNTKNQELQTRNMQDTPKSDSVPLFHLALGIISLVTGLSIFTTPNSDD